MMRILMGLFVVNLVVVWFVMKILVGCFVEMLVVG